MLDAYDFGNDTDGLLFDEAGAELAVRWPAEDLVELEEEAGEDDLG